MTPRCSHCEAPAAWELLLPSGEPFTPRLLACEFGAAGYSGRKRKLTLADYSTGVVSTSPGRLAASVEGGRG